MRSSICLLAGALLLASCVSTKTYNASRAEAIRLQSRLATEAGNNAALRAQLDTLRADTARLGARYRYMMEENAAQATRMLREIEANQRELSERNTRIRKLQEQLDACAAAADTTAAFQPYHFPLP